MLSSLKLSKWWFTNKYSHSLSQPIRHSAVYSTVSSVPSNCSHHRRATGIGQTRGSIAIAEVNYNNSTKSPFAIFLAPSFSTGSLLSLRLTTPFLSGFSSFIHIVVDPPMHITHSLYKRLHTSWHTTTYTLRNSYDLAKQASGVESWRQNIYLGM